MITRELGIKKQLIQITKKGVEILSYEHSDYKQIFDLTDRIFFKGKVVSGLGEGRYYTEQDYYKKQFNKKIGFYPYPGTLNIEIEYIEKNKLRHLRKYDSIVIEGFEDKNRTFGGVRCFKAEVGKIPSALVLPLRSHYSNILEFISKYYLRDKLKLKDGDTVETIIYL